MATRRPTRSCWTPLTGRSTGGERTRAAPTAWPTAAMSPAPSWPPPNRSESRCGLPYSLEAMGFDLPSALKTRAGEGPALWARYLNPQTARVVRSIGFDRRWERGQASYLVDDTGARYLDFLSGFG